MRLNSFSLQKKFSIKCRHLYISRSMSSGVVRRGCWAMTALAPRPSRSAIRALLSKAVSAISAPKASPSMSGGTPAVSKRCPGKSTKRTNCRAHPSRPGFWWSGRLWSGQWPGAKSPLCPLPVPVDFDDGGVDHGVFQVGIVRDGLEQTLPDVRLHPVAKAGEDAVPVPERGRQIAPGTAGADNPQHGFDKQAV